MGAAHYLDQSSGYAFWFTNDPCRHPIQFLHAAFKQIEWNWNFYCISTCFLLFLVTWSLAIFGHLEKDSWTICLWQGTKRPDIILPQAIYFQWNLRAFLRTFWLDKINFPFQKLCLVDTRLIINFLHDFPIQIEET